MRSFRFALVLAFLGFTVIADAGLTPTKGSQLVSLFAAGACPVTGHTSAVAFSQRVGADGSTVPFVIPPKQILVLTDVVAATTSQVPGDVFLVSVIVGAADHGQFVTARFESAPSSGAFSVSFAPANGIAIKAGNTVCLEFVNTTHINALVGSIGFAHGFLAPDK